MEFFWKKKARDKEDIKKGREQLTYYKKVLADAVAQRERKTRRQVELWTVGSLDDQLTAEYHEITASAAYFAQAEVALKDYVKKLDIELYHCQYGQCDALRALLPINPLAGINDSVPKVDFKNLTVS